MLKKKNECWEVKKQIEVKYSAGKIVSSIANDLFCFAKYFESNISSISIDFCWQKNSILFETGKDKKSVLILKKTTKNNPAI